MNETTTYNDERINPARNEIIHIDLLLGLDLTSGLKGSSIILRK